MRLLVLGTVFTLNMVLPVTANADPTPAPSPPYLIQSPSGPVYGGMRTLPPICGVQPRACAGDWNPDTGAWDFRPRT
jgi:hypothetical protein